MEIKRLERFRSEFSRYVEFFFHDFYFSRLIWLPRSFPRQGQVFTIHLFASTL